MYIEPGGNQYILIALTGGPPGTAPWDYPAEVAVIPMAQAENGGPVAADWKTGNWVPVAGGRKELALMYTPETMPPGEYMAYARPIADPEAPWLPSGRVQIGHG
jgi:hypothetical protein